MIEDLRREQREWVKVKAAMAKRKWRIYILILTPVLILLLIAAWYLWSTFHQDFETTHYTLTSSKLTSPVKLAVLSDLHSMEYGEENRTLIEAIQTEQPDLIFLLGDMVNKEDRDFTPLEHLCKSLSEIAPVYCTLGNHEGTLMYSQLDTVPLDEKMQANGAHVLINQTTEWEKEGAKLQIAGVAVDAEGYDQWAREELEDFWTLNSYKIVLSHFPNLYQNQLANADFDLALAGHYHGGLICIPGIGGLYHPETGFFPKYWGGEYPMVKGTLIVSRGIGSHGWIPRVNNPPELVIVEINPNTQEE